MGLPDEKNSLDQEVARLYALKLRGQAYGAKTEAAGRLYMEEFVVALRVWQALRLRDSLEEIKESESL